MNNVNLIGLGSAARRGKDSLAQQLQAQFHKDGRPSKIYSLAHALKRDVAEFLFTKCGMDVWTQDTHSKSKFRELLVAYGKIQRERTEGQYWTSITQKEIEGDAAEYKEQKLTAIVSDIRYCHYEGTDEIFWVRKLGGLYIDVNLTTPEGVVPPANEDERINSAKLYDMADIKFWWAKRDGKVDFQSEILPEAKDLYDKIIGLCC